jgi:hypothetical protein
MFISTLGTIICFFYRLQGRVEELDSLEGYPRFYQRLVIKLAARQATKDQSLVIASSF